jgi:hypothetical protein
MIITKIFVVLAIVGGVYHFWHGRSVAHLTPEQMASSPGEFIATAMPDGAEKNKVLILAPVNCPSAAAKRADSLAAQLENMGIPVTRSNSFALRVNNPSEEDKASMERAASVLRGEIPAVFINGMGKANPSAEEVASVYRQTQ